MRINLNNLVSLFFLVAFFVEMGCQDVADTAFADPYTLPTEILTVGPDGHQELGYFEKVVFTVSLSDEVGNPLSDVPVEARLIGEAYNASLEPAELHTAKDGTGQVTFTAPDREVSFDIRFKSPTREVLVPISVDSTRTGISLDVAYSGDRAFSTIEAQLYEMTDTFSCAVISEETPIDIVVDRRGITPTTLTFFGLRQDASYSVKIMGKNANGEIRASGCVSDFVPAQAAVELSLTNTPMNAAGAYNIQTSLDTTGEFDELVDLFSHKIHLIADPAAAILDNISGTLDQFAVESYVRLREDQGLDELLTAGYFGARGIDVGEAMGPVWDFMKGNLSGFKAVGTFELATAGENEFILYHVITSLQFPREGNAFDLTFKINNADPGVGTARFGGNSETDDTLVIDTHQIHMGGLGEPLSFLFREALQMRYDTIELGESLESIVDCAAVAEFLEEPLSDVAARATIEEGCLLATMEADGELQDQVTELNRYDSLSFKGHCDLEIPMKGNAIERLTSGEFSVSWESVSHNAPLVGMQATFEATRVQQIQ